MRSVLRCTGALALLLGAGAANAASIGSADASVSILLDGLSSSVPLGSIVGYTALIDADAAHDPAGFASVFDRSYPRGRTALIGVGDRIGADVSAGARAVGPVGLSAAFIQSAAVLSASNPTASALDLTFRFGFDLLSEVSVTDVSLESSVAFSQFSASFFDDDAFTPIFQATTEADSDFGPLSDSLDDSVLPDFLAPFSVTLAPGQTRTIALTALAEIEAASLVPAPVPLPLSALLLAQALALLPLGGVAKRAFRGR